VSAVSHSSALAAHTAQRDRTGWLATECRTARLASEYRPRDLGGGRLEVSALALGALRELGEEEDGYITDDGDGLRIWVGAGAIELQLQP
jgi:hypothetical protein